MFKITLNNKNIILNNSISIINILKIDNIYSNKYVFAIINKNEIVNLEYIIFKNVNIDLVSEDSIFYKKIIKELILFFLGFSIKNIFNKSYLIRPYINNNYIFYDFFIKSKINMKKIDLLEENINNIFNNKYIIENKKIKINEIKNIFYSKYKKYLIKFHNINPIDNYINVFCYKNYINILNIDNINKISDINLLKLFKLDNFIYSIWYGNKINKLFNRIYVYLNNKNNILKKSYNYRDHRIINNSINLFYIDKENSGMIFWKKNGLIIFNELKKLIREKLKLYKYIEVITPILMTKDIWNKTEHLKYYESNIFNLLIDDKDYCIKPMNCPGHINIFNSEIKSYKNLPYRISEFGHCHRNELSGSIHGLMRTKSFFQDDGHIFCTEEQIYIEIKNCINMIYNIYSILGLYKIKIKLSTRPENKIGDNYLWDISETNIKNILYDCNIYFEINDGEGAFYGPKIEFVFLDYLNREWQCGTIQLDFFLSKKLNSIYIDKDNKRKNPILIHRAILGSIERFIGIITEEFNGEFPLWLSPIHISILSITSSQNDYINKIAKIVDKNNLRYRIDIRNKKIESKIRDNIILKIPYIFICGDIEKNNNTVSVRIKNNIKSFKLKDIISIIKKKISNREI